MIGTVKYKKNKQKGTALIYLGKETAGQIKIDHNTVLVIVYNEKTNEISFKPLENALKEAK